MVDEPEKSDIEIELTPKKSASRARSKTEISKPGITRYDSFNRRARSHSLYISKTPFPESKAVKEEIPEQSSWRGKIWNSWPLWPIRKTMEGISWMGSKISAGLEWFSETKVGKVVQAITSSPVFRTIAIVMAVLTIAGVLATPGGPVVAAVVGTLSLVAVGVGIAMDTIQTRNTRRLIKENNFLGENRKAKSIQDQLLNLQLKLLDVLKDDLYIAERDNKRSINERYIGDYTESLITPKAFGKAALKNAPAVASSVLQGVSTGGISLVKEVSMSAISLAMESGSKVTMDTVRFQLKKQIDEERDKADTPGYDSIKELKKAAKEQQIQTMALKKLITQEDYWGMSNDKIKERFKEIKNEIRAGEEKISPEPGFFVRGLKTIGSLTLDGLRAHNPFSKYNNPQKIKLEIASPLTKSMESINGIEFIKDNLKPHTVNKGLERTATSHREKHRESVENKAHQTSRTK